ncbi:MAG: sugar nucleotide-binding protein [Anaerolineales bacterium]|nr:sugar nucleotide-binding protein [Anaerolineales bacterium]
MSQSSVSQSKPRLLITGGSSYLGQALVPLAVATFETCYTYFSHDPQLDKRATAVQLDLRQSEQVHRLIDRWQPQIIIHLAGSNRTADMYAVITKGTQTITAAAPHARLIFISSDVVFDGYHAPYDESAPPQPRHEYGRAKAAAEQIVARHPNHVIIRTSLIYGFHAVDRGTQWMMAALKKGETVTLFNNQWRNPIAAETLSQACLELATHSYIGILNVAGDEVLTRADYALKLLDWWQFDKRENLNIAPAPADAPWPPNTTLTIDRAKNLLQTPLKGLTEILRTLTKTSFKT